MRYDDLYSKTEAYLGNEPSNLLWEKYGLIDRSKPVLDVGAGQGRNAFFLARKGFSVDAIDNSLVSVETVKSVAAREGLPIRTFHSGFAEFRQENCMYSGVLLLGLVQILTRSEIGLLGQKAKEWTETGGLLFVTAFSTGDPSFSASAEHLREAGKNSFTDEEGNARTYLEPGEILSIFPGFARIHLWEGLGREHRHPGKPPERHGMVEAVLRRS